jgi:hypothetical protein
MRPKSHFIFIFSFFIPIYGCNTDTKNVTTLPTSKISEEQINPVCDSQTSIQYSDLLSIDTLPNPFLNQQGNPLIKKSDWTCRSKEIGFQAQRFSLGTKPPKPESVRSELKGNQLRVMIEHQGKTTEFTADISWPKTGHAPYPAIIGIGGSWINNEELLNQGIAIIKFPNNEIAEQLNSSSRGKGKFFDLYGQDHSAGALIAWAWGVSRLIDALELSAKDQINLQRLGVTGCSRNGKGALVAGAFDQRIRLTIPQESGSGGSTTWRVSEMQLARGQKVQTLRQIVQENVWFRESFKEFSESANKLPIDQHLMLGMVAPRALLLTENTSMEWLGNESTYVSALAAKTIWQALDATNSFGFSQQGGHNHCQLPAAQAVEVNAFVQKFLLDKSEVSTQIFRTDGNFSTDLNRWINWQTPKLK